MQKMWIQSLGLEDLLEKGMAIDSSIPAWEIPWSEEPGRLHSIVSQRVGHDLMTKSPPILLRIPCVIFVTFPLLLSWFSFIFSIPHLTIMCCSTGLLEFILFEVHWVSWMYNFLLKLGPLIPNNYFGCFLSLLLELPLCIC